MKFIILFLLAQLLHFNSFAADLKTFELKKTISKTKDKQFNIIGVSDNIHNQEEIKAVTYGLAQTGSFLGHKVVNLAAYKVPQMVSRLPDIIPPPAPGPLEAVQEIPSVTNYYDGSLNLNVGVVECHTIAMPGDCVKQSICGWCGQSSSCIRGTQLAPNEICDRQSYVFNPPSKKWNPLIAQQ